MGENKIFYPVVTALEMRRIEKLAVQGGCSEEAFMAEAGRRVALRLLEWMQGRPFRVSMLIGKGNKGGDAFVAGIHLLQKGISVRALSLFPLKDCSLLNQKFHRAFIKAKGIVESIKNPQHISFSDDGLILDGLLGTGFKGKIEPRMSRLVALANRSGKPIFAIDIPSGLNGSTGEVAGEAIVAQETISLGCLKAGFFLQSGWNYTGKIRLEDFGLPEKYLAMAQSLAFVPCQKSWAMPSIVRNRHKYEAGYVVGFSGSNIFRGAPKLAGFAALRSGAGIVRVFHLDDIGDFPASLICQTWDLASWNREIKRASALFIGPGIGLGKKESSFLKKELRRLRVPLVVDADAIQKGFSYPKHAILTPHRGEILRLLGISKKIEEKALLTLCQKWVDRTECILVLKGAPTWIFSKHHLPVIIPHGDPGMAKAGSGDVLTGVIAALLAQKMKPLDAAILGVSLHAFAGEFAAHQKSSYSMIAKDLIDFLPHAIMKHRDSVI